MKLQNLPVPYQGDCPYIFISYSHKNASKVFPVIEQLQANNYRVWYDEGIDPGTEWDENIAQHVKHCGFFIAFLSPEYLSSSNCRDELNYARDLDKNRLLIYLSDVELPGGMSMRLSRLQAIHMYTYVNPEAFLQKLYTAPGIDLCLEDVEHPLSESDCTDKSMSKSGLEETNQVHSISVDSELETRFQELFGESQTEPDRSPLEKKLEAVKTRNFMESIIQELPIKEDSDLSDGFDTGISLVPNKYAINTHSCRYQIVMGKHFKIPDVPGFKTLLFRIYFDVDYQTLTEFYNCEQLHCVQGRTGNETIYFVDDPQTEEDIIILHLNAKEVYVNMGILKENRLQISMRPSYIAFEKQYLDNTYHLSPVGYDLDHINEEELHLKKGQLAGEKWYDADIRKSPFVIIDPETALPIKRELYYDESLKEWRARIKLVPYKSYYTFQIRDGDNRTSRHLSSFEIAKYYKEGAFGFPKDLFKAASYFEEDGSAEALYEIAVLFRSEKSIYDKETYLNYLRQAAEAGSAEASIEYALLLLENSSPDNKEQAELWLRNVQPDFPLRNFILGYLIENEMAVGTIEDAYQTYLKAALDHYEPACVRLGHQIISEESETLKEDFINQLSYGKTIADYCMGCILFFGIDILPNKVKGIKFLKKSSEAENVMATQVLHEIGDVEPEFAEDITAFFKRK